MKDFYSGADVQVPVIPVSVSGASVITSGTAVSTSTYEGVILCNLTTSALTGAQTVSGTMQYSGAAGWVDGNYFGVISSGSSIATTSIHMDSRLGANIRPIVYSAIAAGAPALISVVTAAPLKIEN